jgi:hypothetical protein
LKVGLRKPSIKRSLRARTTGRVKRSIKRATNPFYGKRGFGFIKNPKRSINNRIYRRTTFGVSDLMKAGGKSGCLLLLIPGAVLILGVTVSSICE